MRVRFINALRVLQFMADLGLLAFSFYTAYLLRFEFELPENQHEALWEQLPLFVGGAWLALFFGRAYRRAWRYVSLVDVPHFLYPLIGVGAFMIVLRFTLPPDAGIYRVPLSVSFMSTGLAFVLLMAMRIFWRLNHARIEAVVWPERARLRAARGEGFAPGVRQVLIGAGDAGVMAAREFRQRGQDRMLAGFVDDDPMKLGQVIAGLKVLGRTTDIPDLYQRGLF
jgi:FlaA1/EpsC-like NDP-sugar epimerase